MAFSQSNSRGNIIYNYYYFFFFNKNETLTFPDCRITKQKNFGRIAIKKTNAFKARCGTNIEHIISNFNRFPF